MVGKITQAGADVMNKALDKAREEGVDVGDGVIIPELPEPEPVEPEPIEIKLEIPLPVRGESYWTLDMNSIPYKKRCIPDLTDFYNINYSFVFRDKTEAELNAPYHKGHIKAVLDTYARLNKELAERKGKS